MTGHRVDTYVPMALTRVDLLDGRYWASCTHQRCKGWGWGYHLRENALDACRGHRILIHARRN